jgi:phage-related protein/DNA-binding XRE family transcriptional regulator
VQAVYYRDKDGNEPVNDFIDELSPAERQEETDYMISLLNRLGANDPPLPFPFSSQVDGQLRELRCHYGRDLYRILYRRSGNLFVLLHAVAKRTRALPPADIEIAKQAVGGLPGTHGPFAPTTTSRCRPRRPVTRNELPSPALINTDKVRCMPSRAHSVSQAVAVKPAARVTGRSKRAVPPSPVGATAVEASARRAARSPAYRAQQAERQGFREIAWLLIKYRMDKGLTQEELAALVGTSNSQISRIESGRHRTNLDTLLRIARALDLKMILGFESTTPAGRAKRELVAL